MGRRALRKIDPRLSLRSGYSRLSNCRIRGTRPHYSRNRLRWKSNSVAAKGYSWPTPRERQPDRNFLGIELAQKYATFAAARLARAGLANARMVGGDGLRVFREILPSDALAAVHVYFPDPWWKARHKKRRVMNESFLRDAQRTLRPSGSLHFWTDVEEYFHAGLEAVREFTSLEGPLAVAERPAEHDLDYRTHFERRTRLHGQDVYRAEFRKPAV